MTCRAARVVVAGEASGDVVHLTESLSFWGGFDAETGRVTDVHHPQHGQRLDGRVVLMPSGRGSSSATSVLAEAARVGTNPVAFIMIAADEILSTGAIVADELYGRSIPILEVDAVDFGRLASATRVSICEGDITVDAADR